MPASSATARRSAEARTSSLRLRLEDGRQTTLHVARFERRRTTVELFAIEPAAPLLEWCRQRGLGEAMVGGFFVRPQGTPLGELRIDGRVRPSHDFDPPWDTLRSCVHVAAGEVRLASRIDLGANPLGDLLQAGPMLVRDGRCEIVTGSDPEGFSAGSHQFDSDITAGRYPRSALGLGSDQLIAAVCDGRAEGDAGLTLAEMAEAMIGLGAREAINLDGGGSASLVSGRHLVNRPREEDGTSLGDGRKISTALVFLDR